jgi:hypothetical protein
VYGFNNQHEGNSMGLKESLTILEPKYYDCSTAKLIKSMPKDDRESVENAIVLLRNNKAAFSRAWLLRKITDEGYRLKQGAFRSHVVGECTCEPK